eukprot:COSAG02_NODE_17131_length_1026_cov_1.259978_1_plen_42_part_10
MPQTTEEAMRERARGRLRQETQWFRGHPKLAPHAWARAASQR